MDLTKTAALTDKIDRVRPHLKQERIVEYVVDSAMNKKIKAIGGM